MKNIIKKCIDELNKENPKLDYVRGMLEVLFEQEEVRVPTAHPNFIPVMPDYSKKTLVDGSINPHGLPENDGFKVLEK